MARAVVFWCVLAVVAACSGKKTHLAELTKADGPVDRQAGGQTAWAGAAVGTKYYLGDAARTADGTAELVLAGAARIAMQPHTVLRFGGTDAQAKIEVELGEILLSGAGSVGLSVGNVQLADNGTVRVRANSGKANTIELMVGNAKITTLDGQTQQLQIGQVIDFELGKIKVETLPDAGVADAPAPDAGAPDAGVTEGDADIEVTGKGAEILAPGETKWTKLPPDQKTLPQGTLLRLDGRTKAKLAAKGLTLELAGGSRTKVTDNLIFGLELGNATASIPAATTGQVSVPGGEVALTAPATSPAQAKIEVTPRGDARVSIVTGSATLTGTGTGATIDIGRGQNATVQKAGTINPGDVVIPKYFDFRVVIGETPNFTIHDPAGATALQFDFNGKCAGGGGEVEVDQDSRFRMPRVSAGKESANILMKVGGWQYRLRCENGHTVASGRLVIAHDSGARPLPKDPPRFPIDADGRTYRIDYQSLIPNIKVKTAISGASVLHLATGGTEQTYDSTTGSFDLPGKDLKEATYTFWVEHGGEKSKVSTLKIGFDQTAAQVYISSPTNGQPWGAEIDVRGATLPGWTAKIDGLEIPVDKSTRRFTAKVAPPSEGNALAIRLSHPLRGVHYYLRRAAK
jgi:hypothetical protein